MGLVAEYGIPCEHLPLVDVAAAVPDATLDVDIQFNHGDRPPFLVYATHDDHASIEDAFDNSAFVDAAALVGRAGETRRYQIRPAVGMDTLLGDHLDDLDDLRALATAEAIVERIRVTPTGWVQTCWFADRAAFDAFRTFWRRNDCFSLHRLTHDGEPEAPGDGLTDRQREALRIAHGMGYFDIPRRASLDDVAAELGITASALSERLRRAQTHLIETTVGSTWPPLPDAHKRPHD